MPTTLFDSYQLILDNECASLICYPEHKIIHHKFHRPVTSQEFRNVLELGLEALQKYGATKWLSDERSTTGLSVEDRTWTDTEWFPRAAKAGWKSWALVVPPEIHARMQLVDPVTNAFEDGVRTMVFTDPEAAKQWLEHL